MFIRKNKNRSGSVSVQIVQKTGRKNKVIKTVGLANSQREEELLTLLAKTELEQLQGNQSLFIEHDDLVVDNFVESISNDHLQIVGSEVILGKIYKKNRVSTGWVMRLFQEPGFVQVSISWQQIKDR
jgi:hypothetical protein